MHAILIADPSDYCDILHILALFIGSKYLSEEIDKKRQE